MKVTFHILGNNISCKANNYDKKFKHYFFVNCCRYKFLSPGRSTVFTDLTAIRNSTWVHIVVNILPPNQDNQKIIYVYNNGILANGLINDHNHIDPVFLLNDGQMVVGRYLANRNGNYGTFKIDELIFFNHALTPAEIAELSQTTA